MMENFQYKWISIFVVVGACSVFATIRRHFGRHLRCCLFAILCTLPSFAGGDSSRLSDEEFSYKADGELPARTAPLLELGDPFLGTGNLYPGFTIPGGAVWQPRLWIYGTLRSAIQTYDRGDGPQTTEWLNRLDLFGNLQLTGSERILIGVQPLHRDTEFTGSVFNPEREDGFENRTNFRLRTLFFEGDFGELFPHLDFRDEKALDYGFSVGRQQLFFQDGLLINDTVDTIGITRNSKRIPGVPWISNIRVTGVWGWNEVNRDDNIDDSSAKIYGLFTAVDTTPSTIEIDGIYVDGNDKSSGDLFAWGFGGTQRVGALNTTIRYIGSTALQKKTPQSDDGQLFFGEVSWTPHYSHNLLYANGFWGVDNFTSAARDPTAGGPLGRTGILFASRNIASFPAPLRNRADEAFGLAVGYQMFFNHTRRQVILEGGGRRDETVGGFDSLGFACRFQEAIGRRVVFQIDGFVTGQEDRHVGYGLRSELTVKF